jgi:predicted nuclease of restriction endonuclease-like (RecB) superfamily
MIRFAEVFPDADILQTLCAKLSWSHFRQFIAIDDPLKRTALSKKPEQTIAAELEQLAQSDALEPCLLFKDPYVLDFLQLNDRYLAKDLEDAILRWLAKYE